MSKVSMKKLLISALGLLLVLFMAIGILVACNEDGTAVVSFDIGYEGGEAIESQTVKIGESVTLPSVEAARDGWSFVGWKQSGVDDDGLYVAGSSIKVLNDMTFVAQWQPTSLITVTFDANYQGAPAIDSKSVGKGEKIILPNAPDRSADGYIFDGWHIEGASQLFQAGAEYTVTVEVKFVASWSDNGIITAEYRGDYKYSDVEYLGQELGITEYYHITKDQIYYQGLPVTDLKKIDGGYSFVAHCYDNELGYASGTTDADDIHHGQDGYDYNVFELSFVAEMRYEFVAATGKKEICVYSKGADGTLEVEEPEVLEKVTFEAVFQGAGEGGTELRVPLVDYKVQAPQYTDTGFAGWYTAPNGFYLPGEKLDESKEYYQTIVFAPIYEYLGYYNNAETGDKLLLEKDNEGSWASILESGASYKQQLGSFAYDSVNKQVSVYSTESGKKIYVFQLDIENREYTDITPDFDLAEQFIGHWYGLYLEGKYYEIDITEGSYSVSSWEPGRQKVNGSQANYTTTAEGAIGVRVNYTNIYLSLNADGTLKAEYGKTDEATLVKVGTVIGNWHSDDASLVFKAEGVLEANGVSGTYQAASSGYTATVGEEHLTISVSEYGEMTVTSDLDSSELAGYYIPGTQAYVHPEPTKDALEGEFQGYYDDDFGFIFTFDGLGGYTYWYWDLATPGQKSGSGSSIYTLEESNVSFNCEGTNFTGVLNANGKVLVVTDDDDKTYVLVKKDAIEGTFSIDGVSYTFADGDVSFDGKNLKYELVGLSNKNHDKFVKWVATDEGKMIYSFHFDEEAKLVLEKEDLTIVVIPSKDLYYGTWTVSDGEGDYEIIIKSDGTGSLEYIASDWLSEDIDLIDIAWTYDDATGKITFTASGIDFTMLFKGNKCYLTVGSGELTDAMTKTAEEQAGGGGGGTTVDYQALLKGTWGTVDDPIDYWVTYTFKFDGNGKVTITGDDLGDESSAEVDYTLSADGTISFNTYIGEMDDVTGTITADGKLTLNIWGSEYTLTKKK